MKRATILILLVSVSALLRAAPATVDFNSPNDLTGNFATGGSYQQTSSGGITGGAVTSVKGTGGFATYQNAEPRPYRVSISFYYDNPPVQKLPLARVGWGGASDAIDFVSPTSYIWAEFLAGGVFRYVNRGIGNETGIFSIAPPPSDRWLNIEISAVPIGNASQYTLSASLWDLGSNGTDPAIFLGGGAATVQNSKLESDFSLFTGFYGDAPVFDNFQIIPEPATASLLTIGVTAMVALRIGRNRRWFRSSIHNSHFRKKASINL